MRSTLIFFALVAILASIDARCNVPNPVRVGKPLAIDSFADQNNGVFYFFYHDGAQTYFLETCRDQDCTQTNPPAVALPQASVSPYNLFKAVQFNGGSLLAVSVLYVNPQLWNIAVAINGQRVIFANGQNVLPVYATVQDLSVISTYGGQAYLAVTGKGNDGKNFVVIYTVGKNNVITGPQTQVTTATSQAPNIIKGVVNPIGLLPSWIWNTDGKDFGRINCVDIQCSSAPLRFLQSFPAQLQLKQSFTFNLVSGKPVVYIAQNGSPLTLLECRDFTCAAGFSVAKTAFNSVPVTSSFTNGGKTLQLALNTNPNQVDVYSCSNTVCTANSHTHSIRGLNYAVATWANTQRTSSLVLTEASNSRTLLYNFC